VDTVVDMRQCRILDRGVPIIVEHPRLDGDAGILVVKADKLCNGAWFHDRLAVSGKEVKT